MMITTGELLNYNVEGKRVRDMVCDLLHLLFSRRLILLCKAELAELVTAPGKEFCILLAYSFKLLWIILFNKMEGRAPSWYLFFNHFSLLFIHYIINLLTQ